MATVFEECTNEEQRSVVRLLWGKELTANHIIKEIIPVFGAKCVSCRAVHNGVKNFSQAASKVAYVTRPVRKWLRQQPKYFYAAGKAMGLANQCWWRLC
jgi:hypothetical protein